MPSLRFARGLLCAVASLAGCKANRPALPVAATRATPQDDNARVDELVRQHFDARVAFSPTTASWLGVPGVDDRLDDTSAEALARETTRLRALLADLATLTEARLDASRRFDRQLLEREARLALFDLVDLRSFERNPTRYSDLAESGIGDLLARHVAPLGDRLRGVTGRLTRLRGLFDEARRNLRNPPELATRRAIERTVALRSFVAEVLPKVVSAAGDERLSSEFKPAQLEALRALDDHAAWLQRELLPRARGELALGRERLAERLRLEGLDVPLETLLEIGDRELRAARARWEVLAATVAPGRSPADAMRLIEDDHPAAEELLPATTAALELLARFLRDHRLLALPETRPKVAEMPPFLWGFALLSPPAPFETRSRDAYFYVDPVDRDWQRRQREEHLRALNRSQIVASAMHEVLPGHFVQSEAAHRTSSTMQRLSHCDAFIEGWAGYGEELLLSAGFGDPRLRLLLLRSTLLRLGHLVAVLRLHALGGRLDEVARLLAEEAVLDEYSARREAERAALDPLLLAPALGRLQLLKLRADAERAGGEAFSLVTLHERLLGRGAATVPQLRALLLGAAAGPSL